MRRLSLGSLLIALNAGLVLVAVVGLAAGAVRVLRQLADRQALARVELAARSAAAAIERSGDRVLASARLEADRPALGRIVSAGDRAALEGWLDRFRRTSELSGCALFAGGRLLASAGPALPWEELRRPGGGRSLVTGAGGLLILGGSAPLAAAPQVEAVTARVLDEGFARRLGRQLGLAVAVLDSREAGRAAAPRAAARLDAVEMYVADRPLFAPSGQVAGVVEARLPTATVDGPLASLVRQVMLLALAVAALATLVSAAAGRWLGRPVRELTASAARLGRGDLTTPIGNAPGRELGALAATLEETRRQLLRLTAELRRRQAEGEAVLTGIAEGVASVDRDRRIRYLNPQAAALLGIRAEEALGRFCGDVLNPRGAGGERPCEESCPIVHARFRGSARATEQLQLAGSRRRSVVVTSAGPVEETQFLVLRDETDLELARRQRDTVLANISHEFKTPLAAQRASLELLRGKLLEPRPPAGAGSGGGAGTGGGGGQGVGAGAGGGAGPGGGGGAGGSGGPGVGGGADAEVLELVLALERGGLRLAQLIDNLLESVRIESGQDGLRRRPVALDEVIEEAVELTAPLFAQRRQRVEVELPYPLPPVVGDAPRLTQVFVNLLANAQKFAPAGSSLAVGGEVAPGEVTLWVDDQGPGLPALGDSGRELFRRFVRSPGEATEPEQSGMGLGLWIVQSIVERHGGQVVAERREPGTRMRVTLPLGPPADGVGANGAGGGGAAAGGAAAGGEGREA
jgi:signal transduction histidine kinase